MVHELIKASYFRIKYKDFFHMKHFYTMCYEWLIEEGWSERDEKFDEILYLQIEHQKAGNEIWTWWRCTKKPEGTEKYAYWQIELKVDMHVVLLRDSEVVFKGQKYPTNWGEVEIKVWTDIRTDPGEKWKKHWLLKHFNDIMRGNWLHEQVEKARMEAYRDSYRFQEVMKYYLNLKTYLPEPEGQAGLIMPKKGIGEP